MMRIFPIIYGEYLTDHDLILVHDKCFLTEILLLLVIINYLVVNGVL